MPTTPKTALETLQEIEIALPIAIGLINAIKKAINDGNGSMTVDQLLADAEAGWSKTQGDLDELAKEGH